MKSVISLILLAVAVSNNSPAATSQYCNGQTRVDDWNRVYYPNGQIIKDGWERVYYPNGQIVTDGWDRVYYPNGQIVKDGWDRVYYPNGQIVKDGWDRVYYPNAQIVKDGWDRCYHPNGTQADPCPVTTRVTERIEDFGVLKLRLDTSTGELRDLTFEIPEQGITTYFDLELSPALDHVDISNVDADCGIQ